MEAAVLQQEERMLRANVEQLNKDINDASLYTLPAAGFYLATTRMWANAQRDGCPAGYRWRPLFNAAKFG